MKNLIKFLVLTNTFTFLCIGLISLFYFVDVVLIEDIQKFIINHKLITFFLIGSVWISFWGSMYFIFHTTDYWVESLGGLIQTENNLQSEREVYKGAHEIVAQKALHHFGITIEQIRVELQKQHNERTKKNC